MQIIKALALMAIIGVAPTVFATTPIEQRIVKETLTPLFQHHRATTSSGDVIPENQFDDAQVCGGCHIDIYKEWQVSMMAHAWDDPIYRALLKRASEATDGELDSFCTGCHSPTGLTTGRITTADNRKPPDIDKPQTHLPGVDCEACHNIRAISGLDNGAYVMNDAGGQKLKYGPRRQAQSPYHETAYSELHTESKLCAACHNVTHPVNGVPVERTYDEWFESPYRKAGVGCQDCHMPTTPGKSAVMGPERPDRATHHFVGGNTTLLEHFGHDKNADRARRLLQSSATMDVVKKPDTLAPGQLAAITLKVTNTGAGHKLPTGFPEGREVWIDLKIKDRDGGIVYRSGAIENGQTEPDTHSFMVKLGDKNGEKVEVEVWRITHIMSDNRILPKGHALVDYLFEVPPGTLGPLTVEADLNYWPFSQAFADQLLGEGALDVRVETITALETHLQMTGNSEGYTGEALPSK